MALQGGPLDLDPVHIPEISAGIDHAVDALARLSIEGHSGGSTLQYERIAAGSLFACRGARSKRGQRAPVGRAAVAMLLLPQIAVGSGGVGIRQHWDAPAIGVDVDAVLEDLEMEMRGRRAEVTGVTDRIRTGWCD